MYTNSGIKYCFLLAKTMSYTHKSYVILQLYYADVESVIILKTNWCMLLYAHFVIAAQVTWNLDNKQCPVSKMV